LTAPSSPFTLALAVPRITSIPGRRSITPSQFARTVASVFDQAPDVDTALEQTVRILCEIDGWSLGQAWMPRADGAGLEWRAGWTADPRFAGFAEASRAIVFEPNAVLPGRAWTSRRAIALPDLRREPQFYRAQAAAATGLRAAVAFPLSDDHGVPAVLELLDTETRSPEPELVDLISQIAPALVDFLERRRMRAQKEGEERVRALFESPTIGIVFWERDGRIVDANPAFLEMVGYSREELLAGDLSWPKLSVRDERLDEAVLRQIETTGSCPPFEMDCIGKHGQRVPVLIGGSFGPDRRGVVSYVLDVTEQRLVRDALRESEARFRAFMDNGPAVAFMKDEDGRHVYHNAAWSRAFDRPGQSSIGRTELEMFPADVAESLRENDRAVLAAEHPVELWERVPTADGVLRDWLMFKFPFDSVGGRRLVGGVGLDMTERRRIDAALLASEERHRHLVEHAPDAMFLVSAARVTFVNRAGVRLLRASSPQEIVGKTVFEVVHADYHAVVGERLRHLAEHGQPSGPPLEQRFVRVDGSLVDVEIFAMPLPDGDGLVQVVARDITDRKQAEEERARLLVLEQAARAESLALSRKLVDAQESERRRIAHELHDEIGQRLTGLSLLLKSGEPPPGPWRQRCTEAQQLLLDLTTRVRDMSLDLRPAMLDDIGLLAALLWQSERYMYQTKIRIHFHHFGLDRRFPAEMETAAYRLVQEALTNVARHSKAGEADVHVRADGGSLWLRVSDRGVGFDPGQMGFTGSMGLVGMRERVSSLGGELRVESLPGGGTSVTAWFPLAGAVAPESI
jgi:PAS domain S-box-containing protein